MTRIFMLAGIITTLALASATPTSAYTCSQHYQSCLGYGHGPSICGCARSICLKAVGPTGDAQAKWNYIPGINACWKK
jgi:hypothetical protein